MKSAKRPLPCGLAQTDDDELDLACILAGNPADIEGVDSFPLDIAISSNHHFTPHAHAHAHPHPHSHTHTPPQRPALPPSSKSFRGVREEDLPAGMTDDLDVVRKPTPGIGFGGGDGDDVAALRSDDAGLPKVTTDSNRQEKKRKPKEVDEGVLNNFSRVMSRL